MKQRSAVTLTVTLFMLLLSGFTFVLRSKSPTKKLTPVQQSIYRVVIDKSKYELTVFDPEGYETTYPVVFGSSDRSDKMMEGDRKTPEGNFKIIAKKIHPEWGYFLLLDYPTPLDLEKFNERKRSGAIPSNAKPGGGIGIHATRKNEDRYVDYYYNWTLGCISTKREYAKELYDLLPVGTEVTILH